MPGKHRAHTPITSEAQQGMMGAELQRRREGKGSRMKGMTTEELRSHLKESAGKNLPEYAKRSVRGSAPFTTDELSKGYRKLGAATDPRKKG
jgi:hypothetical protein